MTIEDDVFVGPNAVFTNHLRPLAAIKQVLKAWLPTVVRRGATIGASATIVCGLTIGEHERLGDSLACTCGLSWRMADGGGLLPG